MSQLTLFTPQFDERVRRVEVDGVTYFSAIDIFVQYGSEGSRKDPRKIRCASRDNQVRSPLRAIDREYGVRRARFHASFAGMCG